jgi:hypothetical protein
LKQRLIDRADWTGITIASTDVGSRNKPARWRHDGYQYATAGEHQMAVLLSSQGIPFTPDVRFDLLDATGTGGRVFIPDFVFNGKAFIWTWRGKRTVIHGIEAKGKGKGGNFSPRALENVALLKQQRGITILLLSNGQIKQLYNASRRLPLTPLDGG